MGTFAIWDFPSANLENRGSGPFFVIPNFLQGSSEQSTAVEIFRRPLEREEEDGNP